MHLGGYNRIIPERIFATDSNFERAAQLIARAERQYLSTQTKGKHASTELVAFMVAAAEITLVGSPLGTKFAMAEEDGPDRQYLLLSEELEEGVSHDLSFPSPEACQEMMDVFLKDVVELKVS